MDLRLAEKVVLVSGGSKGIGQAIARSFLRERARVANVSRRADEDLPLEASGERYLFVQTDLADPQNCRQAVDQISQRFGRIDVLVNNAGVNDGVSLEAGPDAFVTSLYRNLVHYYALAHYALPALKDSRGTIINIGSKVSVTGQGKTSGYAASKGGINSLTREWAVDLAPYGIRVNTVIPAEVWTPLYANWLQSMPNPESERHRIEQLIPLGRRFTHVDEIANMVVFLASDCSSHTTGQIIFVDGGYTHLDRKATAF